MSDTVGARAPDREDAHDVVIPFAAEIGQPECLTYEPKGYRDLLWCPHLNEPVILEYRGVDAQAHCVNCGVSSTDHLQDTHTFIAHVLKPWGIPAQKQREARQTTIKGRPTFTVVGDNGLQVPAGYVPDYGVETDGPR